MAATDVTLLALAGIGLRHKKVGLHNMFNTHVLLIDLKDHFYHFLDPTKDELLMLIANGPM